MAGYDVDVLVIGSGFGGSVAALRAAQAGRSVIVTEMGRRISPEVEHGLPLLLTAPDKELTGGADPSIIWKDETGTLAVGAGEHFGLEIREEPADIPRLKATLDRDLLRRNTVVREEPDLLVWRSEFPDDPSLVFIHFYRVLKTDRGEL